MKQKSFEKNIKQQNRNTGYPAQDPTTNKYFSGSGWEIMYLCFVCYFVVFFSKLVYVLFCCYMCFFDCNCKSLNRLGESITKTQTNRTTSRKHKNNRNTRYPAHEPPRIYIYIYIYISYIYSRRFVGWISCISVVYVFLDAFLFFLFFFFFFFFA